MLHKSRIMALLLTAGLSVASSSSFASSTATIEVNSVGQPTSASSITISFSDSAGRTYSQTVAYGPASTPASVASMIGAYFSNAYVPGGFLSAQVLCGASNIVRFSLKSPATFGNLTITGPNTSFQFNSSGFASSGSRTNPSITWPTPAPISAGTALSGTQLNAAANVPGIFTYFPGPGAVLNAGTQILSVTFTPTDTTDYAPASATVTLVVNSDQSGQNAPTISWATPAAIAYGTPLSSAQLDASASYNGSAVPGVFEYTPAAGEVLDAGTQTLLVMFFPNDSVHYTTAGGSVLLQVTPSSSTNPQTIYSYSIVASGGGSGYASNSNLQSLTDSVTGSWNYTYDTLNRLLGGTSAAGTSLCWSYDAFGNRAAQVTEQGACPPTLTATAQYNAHNQNTSLNYDSTGAGYVTADGFNSYIYDGEGRICAVMNEPVPSVPVMTQYIYNAEGVRVAKGTITNWSAGCDTTRNGFVPTNSYVLGLSNEQLSETDGNGNWLHSNVYANGALIATYDIPPANDDIPPNQGLSVHFQLEDWLGTRRVQTDISGNVEETFTSQPFGDNFIAVVPQGAPPTAEDATEHHFTGKERDAESGNDYFGARYYASSMGRWLSPDPAMESEILENPQTWNRYSYVYNRPLYGTDPDGRCPPCVGAIIGGVVGGAVGGIAEGGFSAVSQYVQNGSIDWSEVGASAAGGAVSGAITGGITGATGGLSLLADAGIGAGANAIGGEVTRLIEGKDTSASDVVEDAAAGYAGGTLGHIAADVVHIPPEPKPPNNLKSYLKMKKYNAKLLQRNVAKGVQIGVGTATGTPPAHTVSGSFWLLDLLGNPPAPPPPPPPPCATTSATDREGNTTGTSGCQ